MAQDSGQVQVYQNIGGVWTQIGDNLNGEGNIDPGTERFGFSVSLSSDGSILAIGAPGNEGNGFFSGNVRIYENIGGIWTQIGFDIDGESQMDQSGWSVSLSSDGSIVAIGANKNDPILYHDVTGHVRIYKNIGGVWMQVGSDIDGQSLGDLFGSSVSYMDTKNLSQGIYFVEVITNKGKSTKKLIIE